MAIDYQKTAKDLVKELGGDAGVGVAMANGSDATRAAADFVTASNDEDGIAIFIEEHLL